MFCKTSERLAIRFIKISIFKCRRHLGQASPSTCEAITVGGADSRFAYPATEDWQKTIGGHSIWTGSNITITRLDDGRLLAEANVTLNAEDRYNVNPNQQDIATGEPDMVRGVLEETGLAHQYTQTGSSELSTSWIIGDPGNTKAPSSSTGGSR